MSVADLLTTLADRGLEVVPAAGGRLLIRGPAGSITPELWQALEAAKQDLLAMLLRASVPASGTPEPVTEITETGNNCDSRDASGGTAVSRFVHSVATATSWGDLEGILTEAQLAWVSGELTAADVEAVAESCRGRAGEVPRGAC